ncbi:hypothetical protein PFUGPA_04183 [Plasmodium falciparum Palo Alto/Uganda]|uniref:Uncharacterized protein n=1 Tax=Plasmodium falciparum (isolate Palo Alto / Uganda) TaxID=57270 RepID=W4IWX4_PLAFP|nr:hypothetical protein PFUGPA_04183 [Plasmodium falciparum Palo Alto/Uganda]
MMSLYGYKIIMVIIYKNIKAYIFKKFLYFSIQQCCVQKYAYNIEINYFYCTIINNFYNLYSKD